ncbi:GNAT family N-acetyltransferase [Chloroflexota bacterium]
MSVIRPARESDIPRILELYRQLSLSAELEQEPSLDNYRQVFNEISAFSRYELVVAEEQGEVIGTLVLLIVPNLSHNALPWAIVENMAVDERRRRQGTGKLLMDYAIARAREASCYKIQLLSNKKRDEAHQFYRTLGFEASAHGLRFYL